MFFFQNIKFQFKIRHFFKNIYSQKSGENLRSLLRSHGSYSFNEFLLIQDVQAEGANPNTPKTIPCHP
jgi:hypothetical protein